MRMRCWPTDMQTFACGSVAQTGARLQQGPLAFPPDEEASDWCGIAGPARGSSFQKDMLVRGISLVLWHAAKAYLDSLTTGHSYPCYSRYTLQCWEQCIATEACGLSPSAVPAPRRGRVAPAYPAQVPAPGQRAPVCGGCRATCSTHAHAHAHARVHTHTHTRTRAHMRAHPYIHTRACVRTHTHSSRPCKCRQPSVGRSGKQLSCTCCSHVACPPGLACVELLCQQPSSDPWPLPAACSARRAHHLLGSWLQGILGCRQHVCTRPP